MWYQRHLKNILTEGSDCSPRGELVRECQNLRIDCDLSDNIILGPRKVNYRFMLAEFLWMWFGRNDVETLAQYNPHMVAYSDDGSTLSGAYGKKFQQQHAGLVDKLRGDSETRQAVVAIWPPDQLSKPSNDPPCTLTWHFLARRGKLHMTADMRSSDGWLGVPYDVYSFSMMNAALAAELHLEPGDLTLTMHSAHLYEYNRCPHCGLVVDTWRSALRSLSGDGSLGSPRLPAPPPAWLEKVLVSRHYDPTAVKGRDVYGLWGLFALALTAPTNRESLFFLRQVSKW